MKANAEKQIKKLERKIKRLDNKIANTNLFRQIYILGPIALAVLTGIAAIISIPFNLIVFQILGVSTLALTGLTFGLNALSDGIDLGFSIKLRKLEAKFEKLKTEYAKLVDQTKTATRAIETNEDQEVVINNGNDISLQKLLEKGKKRSKLKKADKIVVEQDNNNDEETDLNL